MRSGDTLPHASNRGQPVPEYVPSSRDGGAYEELIAALAAVAASVVALSAGTGAASAAPPETCTADLTIFTTSVGTVSTSGQVTHFRDSGVGGAYTSGFLAGYTLSGAQDIMVNNVTQKSQLHGEFTAVGPGGTLTIRYNGHVDLSTGTGTGEFVTAGGTGIFASFHWTGKIAAQLVSLAPPTFVATDTGPCHTTS
jgi:hypothetical protein